MNDLDDTALRQELDRISKRVEDIMGKVDALYPPQNQSEPSEDDSTPASEDDSNVNDSA